MRSRILAACAAVIALTVGLVTLPASERAEALSPDLPFSADALPTWQTNNVVWQMAASKGKVVVGGSFTQLRPGAGQSGNARSITALAILDAATGQPDACQLPAAFSGGNAAVYAVAAAPDGQTVFVGGQFTSIGGVAVSRLAEIDVATCTVTPFRVSGISNYLLTIQPTADAVYFGGVFQTVAGQTRRSFAKVNRAGALQPWVVNVSGATQDLYSTVVVPDKNARGNALAVSPDGTKVAVGGDWFDINGSASHSFAVVNGTDGAVLQTWPASTVGPTSRTKMITSDGTRFYVAQEGFNGFDGNLAYNWSDYTQYWRDNCAGATQAVVPYQGLLFKAHHHHDCSSMGMFPDGRRTFLSVTRADDTGQRHIGWLPELNDGTGEGIGGRTIAVANGANGTPYLWVGGEFTRVNGTGQQGLTRFSATDTGAPATPSLAVRPITPGGIQVNIRGVYDPDDSDITYAVYRGSNTTTPVWTGVAESMHWYRNQSTFVDTAVTPGAAYTYRVRAIDAAGNQSGLSGAVTVTASATGSRYAATVIGDQPRLYYRYDDVSTVPSWVIDSSGPTVEGLAGTAQNGVARTASGAIVGDPSASATFSETQASGLPQYIWNDVTAPGPSAYSVETWFRTTSTTGGALINYGSIQGRPRSDTGADRVSSTVDRVVYMENGSGFLRFGVRAGFGTTTLRSTAQYNDGAWHHVVATQGPEGMRLYVDGMLQAQNATTGNGTYLGTWHVGGDNLSGYPNAGNTQAARYFHGQLDETAVYETPLGAPQVGNHYTVGSGVVDAVAPTAPSGLNATVDGADVQLTWAPSTDATGVAGYRVHRSGTDGFTPSPATLLGTAAGTAFEDVAPPPGVQHYRVVAFDAAGNESAPSGVATVTVADVTAPTVPTGVVAARNGASGARVTWAASSDDAAVSAYAVYRGTTADFTADAGSRVADGVTATSYDDPAVGPGTWYYRVAARDAAGNTSAPSASAELTIPAPDTTAPTTPAGLTATVQGGDDVLLGWAASSDEVGVTGYEVYRGTSSGFTADAASRVAETDARTHLDADRSPGTWYYRVAAKDAAGNLSAPSAAVEATIAAAPVDPVVQTVVTDADTMAASTNATFVYGTTNQISSRFGSGTIESFMRFPLPAAPAGMVLTGATLTVRTSNDSTAASADVHELRVIDGAWSESALTWNNRPTAVRPGVVGTLTAATQLNTNYTIVLDPAALASSAGSALSLRLSSSAGTDNVRLWSREATSAPFRPTLTLTYTAP